MSCSRRCCSSSACRRCSSCLPLLELAYASACSSFMTVALLRARCADDSRLHLALPLRRQPPLHPWIALRGLIELTVPWLSACCSSLRLALRLAISLPSQAFKEVGGRRLQTDSREFRRRSIRSWEQLSRLLSSCFFSHCLFLAPASAYPQSRSELIPVTFVQLRFSVPSSPALLPCHTSSVAPCPLVPTSTPSPSSRVLRAASAYPCPSSWSRAGPSPLRASKRN